LKQNQVLAHQILLTSINFMLGRQLLLRSKRWSLGGAHNLSQRALSIKLPDYAPKNGLYDPKNEKDSCGVGLVCNLKSKPSSVVVQDSLLMLARMSHRGGCGCDANSGDGAGILVGMPHTFFRDVAEKELNVTLPDPGNYAVGNIFFSKGEQNIAHCQSIFDSVCQQQGWEVLGWRELPVCNSDLGPTAVNSEPYTGQVR
jgi:glutamate synthase domain-containing protein 1